MAPVRLRMAEMRCRVRSMPARLSSPNWPIRSATSARSSRVMSYPGEDLIDLEPSFRRPTKIQDDLDQLAPLVALAELEDTPGDGLWQDVEQFADVVSHFVFGVGGDEFSVRCRWQTAQGALHSLVYRAP